MTTARARLRWVLGAGVLLAFAGAGLGVTRIARSSAPTIERTDGSRVERLRHVRYRGDELILRVTLEEGVVRRPRLGVFRIGFARELVAHDASVELRVRGKDGNGIEPAELGSILGELVGSHGRKDVDLTSVKVERAHLRLLGDDGEWLELWADSLQSGLTSRGRIVLAGSVEVSSDREERLRFARLVFDPRKKSFVEATPLADRVEDGARVKPLRQVLRDLDCAVNRIIGGKDGTCLAVRAAKLPREDDSTGGG